MKRIRTIQGCFEAIKAEDPQTAITPRAIRRAVTEGDIPSRRIGSGKGWKYLVDLDEVMIYFCGYGGE